MFEEAPSCVLRQYSSDFTAADDFYMSSRQASFVEENLSTHAGLVVRLTDFGTGKFQPS